MGCGTDLPGLLEDAPVSFLLWSQLCYTFHHHPWGRTRAIYSFLEATITRFSLVKALTVLDVNICPTSGLEVTFSCLVLFFSDRSLLWFSSVIILLVFQHKTAERNMHLIMWLTLNIKFILNFEIGGVNYIFFEKVNEISFCIYSKFLQI